MYNIITIHMHVMQVSLTYYWHCRTLEDSIVNEPFVCHYVCKYTIHVQYLDRSGPRKEFTINQQSIY